MRRARGAGARERRGASPAASSTAPRSCATIASSIALEYRPATVSSSLQAARASSNSPAASMISTYAGSSSARRRRSERSATARRMAATRRIDAPLRQPQLREPRLRLPAGGARGAVGLFGAVELALEPKELGLAIEGEARCRVVGLDEAPAGSTRLLERVRPRPAVLQDLGAVDEAAPCEGDHVRLLPAPAVECQRPLTRAAKLEDLLAREDDGAVDEARDDRRQVLGVVTATIASSRSARPSATCASTAAACPCRSTESANRSRFAKRRATAVASAATDRAAAASPA